MCNTAWHSCLQGLEEPRPERNASAFRAESGRGPLTRRWVVTVKTRGGRIGGRQPPYAGAGEKGRAACRVPREAASSEPRASSLTREARRLPPSGSRLVARNSRLSRSRVTHHASRSRHLRPAGGSRRPLVRRPTGQPTSRLALSWSPQAPASVECRVPSAEQGASSVRPALAGAARPPLVTCHSHSSLVTPHSPGGLSRAAEPQVLDALGTATRTRADARGLRHRPFVP